MASNDNPWRGRARGGMRGNRGIQGNGNAIGIGRGGSNAGSGSNYAQNNASNLGPASAPSSSGLEPSMSNMNLEAARGRASFRRKQMFDKEHCLQKFDHITVPKPLGTAGQPTKKGVSGRRVNLVANYMKVVPKNPEDWFLFHYHVDFKPELISTKIKRQLIQQQAKIIGGPGGAYICDGQNLWTFERLYQFAIEKTIELGSQTEDGQNVVLIIKKVGELRLDDPQIIQLYNLITRKCLTLLGMTLIGRNYYFMDQYESVADSVNLYRGFSTTMRQFENGILMKLDILHKVVNQQTCLHKILARNPRNTADGRNAIKNELVGQVVITLYNNKTYKIDDVDFKQSPMSTFKERSGNSITFAQYYKQAYNITIHNLDQPLLVSLPKAKDYHRGDGDKPILLVPELCNFTGLTDEMRTNYHLMKKFSDKTRKPPSIKIQTIVGFLNDMAKNAEIRNEFIKYQLKFKAEPVQFQGRVLEGEALTMNGKLVKYTNANWTDHVKFNQMSVCKKLDRNWLLIVARKDGHLVDNLKSTMAMVGKKLGFVVGQPLEIIYAQDTRITNFGDAITNGIHKYSQQVQFVVVILPELRQRQIDDIYNLVKKKCLVDYGLPSQCLLAKNIGSAKNPGFLRSYCTKIVVQINTKMGGEPWQMANSSFKNTMIVGFDVYHCGKRTGKSVGATVATTNETLSQYYSTVSYFADRKEISSTARMDIVACATAYAKKNGYLPRNIIFFRDGVGEGQLRYVLSTEVTEMQEGLKELYAGLQQPKLTVLVVCKRTSTRFFNVLTNPNTGVNKAENPEPGTIVDDVITIPERYDFYLVSNHAPQGGTVSPTSYNVILDEQNFEPDKLQRISYKMTHMYYNWNGTVSVPAVCQYAHKLAYLTGTALGNDIRASPRLNDMLYYL